MHNKKDILNDIFIIITFLMITIIFIVIPPLSNTWVRTLLTYPLVLFFPGYSLIAALFPKKNDLGGVERIALSFGLSIAIVPLLGFGLNYSPWGIRLIPILITIVLFTLSMCLIAIYRRNNLPESQSYSVHFNTFFHSFCTELIIIPQSRKEKILIVTLVISILLSAAFVTYFIINPIHNDKFTEFYILGPGAIADEYPTDLVFGNFDTLIVGVVNHEYKVMNYTIALELDNESLLREPIKITLAHNETWEEKVEFVPDKIGKGMKLQFLLFNENNRIVPYREVHLYIDVLDFSG
jgi:uncharacterized membrane protein